MARIRTIKPEFFRHEVLQDLEIANPGKYPLMVFAGLWGHCDNKGRFEWKPRQLKLDILPFLPFEMTDTLAILEGAGMVNRYTVDGKEYGEIPTFEKHQRLSGKELTEGEKFPPNPVSKGEAQGKQTGSDRDEPESQEGKGKGREEEGNGVGAESSAASPQPAPVSRKRAKKSTQLPADFYPNETGIGYAEQREVGLAVELEAFRNWHLSKGSLMKDWQAAWRTWCDKAVEFGRAGSKPAHRQKFDPVAYVNQNRKGVSDGNGSQQTIDGIAQRVA